MKKTRLMALSALMLGLIVLSGCTSGVAKEDFTKTQSDLVAAQTRITALERSVTTFKEDASKAQNDLAAAQARIAALEQRVVAFSAYHMWYDQFTGSGNYTFVDSATFVAEFGGVVEFIADSDLQTAWSKYVAAEKPLRDYAAGLPADQSTWTDAQKSRLDELVTAGFNALRLVGQALLSAIWNL